MPIQEAKTEHVTFPVEVAFDRIKEMMYRNQLVPGQKLIYSDLAKKLGMSVTPVIQALNRLRYLNIVYSEPNKGFFVGEADPIEADQLFAAREVLEPSVIPDVVRNLTEESLDEIEAAMQGIIEAASVPDYRRHLMRRDTNFHLTIVKTSGNRVIYDICQRIFEQMYLKYRPEYLEDERLKEAGEEHRMVIEALRQRDTGKAKAYLRRNIRTGRKYIVGRLRAERESKIYPHNTHKLD